MAVVCGSCDNTEYNAPIMKCDLCGDCTCFGCIKEVRAITVGSIEGGAEKHLWGFVCGVCERKWIDQLQATFPGLVHFGDERDTVAIRRTALRRLIAPDDPLR